MDLYDRILELTRYGYHCAQILAILLLDTLGEENPGFVRAMTGLNGGIGFSGNCCGCFTGGACILSYITGKSEDTALPHAEHKTTLGEFSRWFQDEILIEYGGVECRDITHGNLAKQVEVCPGLIAATYEKCMELLTDKGLI